MKTLILPVVIILLSLSACKKTTNTIIPTPSANGFTWKENGGATQIADSSFFTAAYNTLIAYKGGTARHFEINLSAGAPATYTIGSGNAFTLVASGNYYIASGGSVIVTKNAASKLSGTFTTTGSGASLTSVNGQFTNIEIR